MSTSTLIVVPEFAENDGLNFLPFYLELAKRYRHSVFIHMNQDASFSRFIKCYLNDHTHEPIRDTCVGYGWSNRNVRDSYRLMMHIREFRGDVHLYLPDYDAIYYHCLYLRSLGLLKGRWRIDAYSCGSDIARRLLGLNVIDDQELILGEELRSQSLMLADTLYHAPYLVDNVVSKHADPVPLRPGHGDAGMGQEALISFFFAGSDVSRTKVLVRSKSALAGSNARVEIVILGSVEEELFLDEISGIGRVVLLATQEQIVEYLRETPHFGRACILDGGLLSLLYYFIYPKASAVYVERPLCHSGFVGTQKSGVIAFNVSPRDVRKVVQADTPVEENVREHIFDFRESLPAPSHEVSLAANPSVTVCVTHFQREDLLEEALNSLSAQTYRNFEVIVSDDGSEAESTRRYLDDINGTTRFGYRIRVIGQENAYLGASRNHGLAHAATEYILFMDDDNLARKDMLKNLLCIAEQHRSDFVGSVMSVFKEEPPQQSELEERFIPVGNAGLSGIFKNNFSDAHGLYRVASLRRLGGFTEHWGSGHEDWEAFFRMSMKGMRLDIHPDVQFDYRVAETSMVRDKTARARNMIRILDPLLVAEQPEVAGQSALAVLLYAQGVWLKSVWAGREIPSDSQRC